MHAVSIAAAKKVRNARLARFLLLFALTLGKSFDRPASGIAHPGMPAPFGVYRTADGWMTISMNPVDRLAEVLELPALASCSDQRLWNERDEVHALIEARSCERFRLLAKRLPEQVRDLYEQLERSEARHFELYLDFAAREYEAGEIAERLEIISAREAELATIADKELRFHSGPP